VRLSASSEHPESLHRTLDLTRAASILAAMRASSRGHLTLYEFDLFAPYPRLIAGCSARTGGVSGRPYDSLNVGLHVGDDPDVVLENRRRVAQGLGVELASLVIPRQIHRGQVAVIASADRGRGTRSHEDGIPDTDALITSEPGVVLAVMLADCVPVIVFDARTPAVGVAHAGWGGTVHHVVRNTVEAMQREFGSDPSRMLAGIGPSIGPASYEVGREVADRATREFPDASVIRTNADGRFLLDLWSSNVADLTGAGVPRASIEVAEIDTYENVERFFSDRRRRPTGRFLAVAGLRA
jgi:polyphenol oxidase